VDSPPRKRSGDKNATAKEGAQGRLLGLVRGGFLFKQEIDRLLGLAKRGCGFGRCKFRRLSWGRQAGKVTNEAPQRTVESSSCAGPAVAVDEPVQNAYTHVLFGQSTKPPPSPHHLK